MGVQKAYAMAAALALTAVTPACAMPLEDAVRKGIANNPQVRAAQAQERAAGTDVSIAKGGYYPNVSLGLGPRTFSLDDYGFDLTVAQMLYDWGRVRGGVDSARATQGKMTQELRVKCDQAALDVVEVYLDILVTERQIGALQMHIASLRSIREKTAARNEGGYSDRSEPERADLEIARATEQLTIEQATLEDARSQFRLLVGEEPTDFSSPQPASVPAYVAGKDLDDIIAETPASRSATADTDVARANLRQTRASIFPQLNLEVSSQRRDLGGILQEDTTVALRLRMSGFQGATNFLRPRGAQQRVEAAIWNEGAVRRDTRRQVQSLLDNAALMKAREPSLALQVDSADQVGRTYVEQFGVGKRDLIDLLNNQREGFEAHRQLIALRVDMLRVQYRAAARLGLLGPLIENRLN